MSEITIQGERCCRCYTIRSLFVGATGGAGLGYFTKLFDPKQPIDKITVEMTSDFLKNNKYLKQFRHFQLGGNLYWRVGAQVVGSMVMYSFLECKFQGGWPRPSMFDSMFAGAITGGAFGLRGIPGGKIGARYGAAGLAFYATAMCILFR